MVTIQCRKIPNLEAPGRDGVQGFKLKKLRGLRGRTADKSNNILNRREKLPTMANLWENDQARLCLKDPSQGNAVHNCRPIACLPLMRRLMTGVIAEVMYIMYKYPE